MEPKLRKHYWMLARTNGEVAHRLDHWDSYNHLTPRIFRTKSDAMKCESDGFRAVKVKVTPC